jgi:Fe-S cluster assembly protein SufB
MSEAVDQSTAVLEKFANQDYKWGFVSDVEADEFEPGLNESIIARLSAKKEEPEWMLQWRLNAYRHFLTMKEPHWPNVKYPHLDLQDVIYYSAPKKKPVLNSLDEADPELLRTFEKLGIPLSEQKVLLNVKGAAASAADARDEGPGTGDQGPEAYVPQVAVDAVFDSVSVATTFKKKLFELGIIFCSMSEAVREHGELVQKYLGSVVPISDNYFASLNSAVFSDGSFVYIPKGVRCPMELSTYFRINSEKTGQFERTLIIADEGAYVSYLEGCTAPMRDENQLHAAVVELIALDRATIKYSTVQNWYPGDKEGKGGIYNFVTKRAKAFKGAKVTWTQVETGSAITWKYPSVILQGDDSIGEFYSVALTANKQQADTGTKMIHIGKNTRSTIVSKGISAGNGQNTYRGQVRVNPGADNARNYSQCDSMLMGDRCGAHTFPYIEVKNPTATVEHEASTSKIGEDQIFYCNQRGIPTEDAVNMIVSGFCKEVFRELPMEFAVEAQKLLGVSLEGSVG